MMESTCGRFQAVRVPGCEHVDRGTCGNACCALQISSRRVPTLVYSDLRAWLVSGGADGSYRYVNMSDGAGHRPSDRLGAHVPDKEGGVRVDVLKDQYALQGRHVTRGGYVDILNFYLRALPSGGTTMRAFSVSGIHGAFSDNGQNYKTLSFMLAYLQPSAKQDILFGCGHPESQAGVIPQGITPISSIVPGKMSSSLSLYGRRESGAAATAVGGTPDS